MRFAADENFNYNIVRGLRLRNPELDIACVHEVKLRGAKDPTVLAWAARENRILLTHDAATLSTYAYQRVVEGQLLPGVFEVNAEAPIGKIIEEILLIAECSTMEEWQNQVWYLPL